MLDGLRAELDAAGPDGIVIDLPPELPIDRIGALDGVHTYPIDTPLEFRSLPPTSLRPENDVDNPLVWLTTQTVRAQRQLCCASDSACEPSAG